RGTPPPPFAQALDEGVLVHELAAPEVDEDRARLHARQLFAADETARLRRERSCEHDEIGAREQVGEPLGPPLLVRWAGIGLRVAPHGDHAETERARAQGNRRPHASETDEPERSPAELPQLRRARPHLLLRPAPAMLLVAGEV